MTKKQNTLYIDYLKHNSHRVNQFEYMSQFSFILLSERMK